MILGPSLGCGGVLTNESGQLRPVDVDGDGSYEDDQDCVWKITAPARHQVIQLSLSGAFDVEQSSGCMEYDRLEVSRLEISRLEVSSLEISRLEVSRLEVSRLARMRHCTSAQCRSLSCQQAYRYKD